MSDTMVEHLAQQMHCESKISLIGEFTYFVGLQLKQMEDAKFVS